MSDVKTRPSAVAPGIVAIPLAQTSKIQDRHHDRLAVIYVRQSSPHQVIDHPESTARQYALVERAVALGWERDRILVIDDDLGQSGRSVDGRKGFQRMRELIVLKHAGLILSLEVSRVARSSRDWHDLFECCGVNDILLSDEDGVYDANDLNDRLILGLKGIMSEMELYLMRGRLERGRHNKAKRGELFQQVPRGYVRIGSSVDKDPDEEVRAIVTLVFDKFAEHKVAYAAARDLTRQGIRLPTRQTVDGSVAWRRSDYIGGTGDAASPDVCRRLRSRSSKGCAVNSSTPRAMESVDRRSPARLHLLGTVFGESADSSGKPDGSINSRRQSGRCGIVVRDVVLYLRPADVREIQSVSRLLRV